ncbi:UNVERIFIED_CONTAM: hypothetical protein FKN15_077239 [Acipenser sinensis]
MGGFVSPGGCAVTRQKRLQLLVPKLSGRPCCGPCTAGQLQDTPVLPRSWTGFGSNSTEGGVAATSTLPRRAPESLPCSTPIMLDFCLWHWLWRQRDFSGTGSRDSGASLSGTASGDSGASLSGIGFRDSGASLSGIGFRDSGASLSGIGSGDSELLSLALVLETVSISLWHWFWRRRGFYLAKVLETVSFSLALVLETVSFSLALVLETVSFSLALVLETAGLLSLALVLEAVSFSLALVLEPAGLFTLALVLETARLLSLALHTAAAPFSSALGMVNLAIHVQTLHRVHTIMMGHQGSLFPTIRTPGCSVERCFTFPGSSNSGPGSSNSGSDSSNSLCFWKEFPVLVKPGLPGLQSCRQATKALLPKLTLFMEGQAKNVQQHPQLQGYREPSVA